MYGGKSVVTDHDVEEMRTCANIRPKLCLIGCVWGSGLEVDEFVALLGFVATCLLSVSNSLHVVLESKDAKNFIHPATCGMPSELAAHNWSASSLA